MKLLEVTRFKGRFQITAESSRGRRYQCLANRRGRIIGRPFRLEASKLLDHDLWLYVSTPPALRRTASEAVRFLPR